MSCVNVSVCERTHTTWQRRQAPTFAGTEAAADAAPQCHHLARRGNLAGGGATQPARTSPRRRAPKGRMLQGGLSARRGLKDAALLRTSLQPPTCGTPQLLVARPLFSVQSRWSFLRPGPRRWPRRVRPWSRHASRWPKAPRCHRCGWGWASALWGSWQRSASCGSGGWTLGAGDAIAVLRFLFGAR